jgi:aliphatic nitrilase
MSAPPPGVQAELKGTTIMTRYPAYKVAAAHVAPVFLATDRSVEKSCSVINEAAGKGARLIAFPESFLPGFPVWAALEAPIRTHELFKKLAASAVAIDGPELARIRQTARRKGVFVSIGFTEGTKSSVGCLWNANALIGADGALLNHHRKLVPTYYEKLIWANGDGRGLRVCATELGRLGMLICGENTNPLARFALMAEGEQVHISSYPPVWPTRPPGGPGNYDLAQAIRIRAGAHAFEAKVFNLVASSCIDRTLRHSIEAALGREPLRILEQSPPGISAVLDPTGTTLGEALCRDEGILYAEIDLARSVEPKQFHDVVGSYNRFDIFTLSVDRSPRRPATFIDEPRAPAGSSIPRDRGSAGLRRGSGSKTQGPARRPGARAAPTDNPLWAGRPQTRPTDVGACGRRRWKSGLVAWCSRLFGELDRRLSVLVAASVAVVFLVSLLLALLLFWVCKEELRCSSSLANSVNEPGR